MEYQRTEADHAVFTCAEGENREIPSIIALYVDDITMASKSLGSINRDKAALKGCYQ
jgi:hypothetical protein